MRKTMASYRTCSKAAVAMLMRERTVSMMALAPVHHPGLWINLLASTTDNLPTTPLQAFVGGGHPSGQQLTAAGLLRKS